jgi:hypothetical protein
MTKQQNSKQTPNKRLESPASPSAALRVSNFELRISNFPSDNQDREVSE